MKKLLLDLLNIQSYPGEEKPVADFITAFLLECGITAEQDEMGNVYAVRGNGPYILLNAHMDSVKGYSTVVKTTNIYSTPAKAVACRWCTMMEVCHGVTLSTIHKLDKNIQDYLEVETCTQHQKYKYFDYVDDAKKEEDKKKVTDVATFNEKTNKIVGNGTRPIGGDDKCGIAMALHFVRTNPLVPIKLFFSVAEEIGCVGAEHAVHHRTAFFQDIIWGLTLDRRGNSDICIQSCSKNNYRSLAFIAEIAKVWILNGIHIKLENGSSADVVHLRNVIPDMVNLSVAYDSPHTNSETVDWISFVRIYDAMVQLIIKSGINYKTLKGQTRKEMIPQPKVVYTPVVVQDVKKNGGQDLRTNKEKEEEAEHDFWERDIVLDATEKEIDDYCTGSACTKRYYSYQLLALECIKRKCSATSIISETSWQVNGVRYKEYSFASSFINRYVTLQDENWKKFFGIYCEVYMPNVVFL